MESGNTNNILSLLESLISPPAEELAMEIAADFRRRRVEKNLTREELATSASISVSHVIRFERSGLISFNNLIRLAMALGYTSEVKNIFAHPKYQTMEELTQIRKNTNKKRAYKNGKNR